MRKPHNLVTAYWDDILYFLREAENAEGEREWYDTLDINVPSDLPEENLIKKQISSYLPPFKKRGIRYTILSSFLFLEAFINQEYFEGIHPTEGPANLSNIQKKNLDKAMLETPFHDKWSLWIEFIIDAKDSNKTKIKAKKEYQDLMELKGWRNYLTHYKIHNLMFVAHELESISTAREALRIAAQSVNWYFQLTKKEMPEWIEKEISNLNKNLNKK